MPEHYKNVQTGKLSDYITPGSFRTISEEMRSIPMGISEFAVEIHLKQKIKSRLSFKTPWDGVLYGCARGKSELKKKLELSSDIHTAYLIDWDDKFLFLLELENSAERPVVYVKSTDIADLLENCRRIAGQESDKGKE